MALASAKQLLDELMGRDRNLPATEKHIITWSDPDVCKNFLVKFCFHDLFVNTKADMGPCPKIHDDRLKKEYENSSRFRKMGYEHDFIHFCETTLSEVERRIQRARSRLILNAKKQQDNQNINVAVPSANEEQVQVLTERINSLLSQVETLGCEGRVEEAQAMMKLCDKLREERRQLSRSGDGSDNSKWMQNAENQEKQMEVCEVCGALLIVGDAPQRVDDHLMGKQHMGYDKVKKALAELRELMEKTYRRPEKEIRPEVVRSEPHRRDSSKHNERERHHHRHSSRHRSRSPREHRHRSSRDERRRH